MTTVEWKKVRELGSGSYGTVYLAHLWGSPTHPIAVKSAAESLEREAAALHRLAGAPNVVQCLGNRTTGLTHNLLLEYAPFGTLEDFIEKEGPMPEWKVARYASMLLRGIREIHSRGLVHCDLKSANVLVFPGPSEGLMELKIADLGLAKWVSEGLYNEIPTWEGKWGDRYYNRGTATTASPESILCHSGYGGYHGPCADIWSIGCIVYEMMTGNSVWEWNGNMEYLYDQILSRQIQFPKNLSQDGVYFLKCCFKDPWTRWSAEQLLRHPFVLENTRSINRPIQSAASCYYKNTAVIHTSYQPQLLV